MHPHALRTTGRAIVLHTLDSSPDHQNPDHMTSCDTGSPAYHPALAEKPPTPADPGERQRGPLKTNREIPGGLQPPWYPRPGRTPPTQEQPPPTIRLGVRGAGSMVDSAESSNGREVLQGNSCSAAAKLDGGPTSGVGRVTDEDGSSPEETTEAGGETRRNGISPMSPSHSPSRSKHNFRRTNRTERSVSRKFRRHHPRWR